MSAFEYTALNISGKTCKGTLEADTARQIRQQLREQHLTPLTVNLVVKKSKQRFLGNYNKISHADLAMFTRQLATLLRSGLTLEEALRIIAQQTVKNKSLILAIRTKVVEGHSLATGLSEFPKIFSNAYCATISAGEQSGYLDLVLERLADNIESRQRLRQKTLLALFYPMLLTAVAMLVIIGLLTYVVPQVIQIFANTKQELPLSTTILINISDFLQIYSLWILLILIILITTWRYVLNIKKFRYKLHYILLKIPLISKLEQGINVTRFTHTLSILVGSGVSLIESLQITAQAVSNLYMQNAILNALNKVREGSSLHSALQQSSQGLNNLFPPIMIHLIANGEASGNLEKMLEHVAINQEQELETLINVLMGLFEPLLILIMGLIVLFIVLSILMPIFELNQLIK
jgi:general secretion pathway protein F